MDGKFLKNERGLFVQVEDGKDLNGQNIIVWKTSNSLSMQWTIEYVDMQTITNGLIPDRAFRIVSKMKGGRALTRNGSEVVISDLNKNSND